MATIINTPPTQNSESTSLGLILGIIVGIALVVGLIVYAAPRMRENNEASDNQDINVDVQLPGGNAPANP